MSHDACSSNLLTAAVTEHSPDLQRSDIDSTIPLTTAIIDDDDDDDDDDGLPAYSRHDKKHSWWEGQRREARREKCTYDKCTLPTILLGPAGPRPAKA